MTKEIINFRCPACETFLQEEDYYEACEEIRMLANEIVRQITEIDITEQEVKDQETISRINEELTTTTEDYNCQSGNK